MEWRFCLRIFFLCILRERKFIRDKKTENMRKKRILVVLLAVLLAWVGSNLVIGALLMNDYPEKIWLHRCNSIEKLYEQGDEYPNVEVDVVFPKNSAKIF